MEMIPGRGRLLGQRKTADNIFESALELLKLMDRALTEGNFHLEEDEEGKEE